MNKQEECVEAICKRAARRVLALGWIPFSATWGRPANAIYMMKQIGLVYDVTLTAKDIDKWRGFLITLCVVEPFIIVGSLTHGLGQAVHAWIKDGRPEDTLPYIEKIKQTVSERWARLKKWL
ncbi:MAG: hypothetical protein GKR87_10490 [Kiritimatiellae bacterium]|nr:hypothetical protein [Kiritimatiellia bacterium]